MTLALRRPECGPSEYGRSGYGGGGLRYTVDGGRRREGSAADAYGVSRGHRRPFWGDIILALAILGLVAFGLVVLFSTTGVVSQERYGDALFFVKRQSIAATIGLIGMTALAHLSPGRLRALSRYALPVAVLAILLPLIPGLGDSAGGARRWVGFGHLRFQPGEFVKVLLAIYLAGYFGRHEGRLHELVHGLAKPFLVIAPFLCLYLLQPDFGSTAVVVAVTLLMAAATGARKRYLLAAGLVVALVLGALVVLSPYRMHRIMSFLSPWSDASGKGYQLIQSLIAVGSGQLSGVGLGASQQKLFFLPAAHTDFIFAVIAEELGFIGCAALIATVLLVFWRAVRITVRVAEDTFLFALGVGMSALLIVPSLLNMGVVTGLLPTKGMVLPFVGYGGSNLIASLFAAGILLALARVPSRDVRG